MLFLYDRLMGTFKDSNVFGPFLVFGVLYCISEIERYKRIRYEVIFYVACIVILVLCNIFATSRGA